MSTSSAIGSPANDLLSPSIPPVAKTISERLSQEIIIALVGPIGSGVSTTADFISDILTSDFAYKVCPVIKPSDIIKAEAHRVGKPTPKRDALDQYIESMQDIGNELRRQFGGDYLSKKIVERIYKFRAENGGINEKGLHIPGRRAYSKRSPEALLAFRVTSMVVRPEARSFRPTLWSTQMTTRRRKCTAVWKY